MKRKILKCDQCEKTFDVYSSFYSHMAVKHGEAKVNCFHCDEKFHTVTQRNHHYYTFASREVKVEPQVELQSVQMVGNTIKSFDLKINPISFTDAKALSKERTLVPETKSGLANYFVDLN